MPRKQNPYIPCPSNSQSKKTPSYLSGCPESTRSIIYTILISNLPLRFTKISPESPLKVVHPGGSILTPNNQQQQPQQEGTIINQNKPQNLLKCPQPT